MEAWYALQVRSNCEALVEEALQFHRLEAYYPSREVVSPFGKIRRRSADGKQEQRLARRPFFPGYVFTRLDWEHPTFRPVVEIPQVVRVLGIHQQPIIIPDQEIESLRRLATSPIHAEVCPYLGAGDRVLVRKGPLQGVEGYVAYVKNQTRVVVSVNLLRQSACAEVEREWLEVLPAKPV